MGDGAGLGCCDRGGGIVGAWRLFLTCQLLAVSACPVALIADQVSEVVMACEPFIRVTAHA